MDLPLCKLCGDRHRLGGCPKYSDPASERRKWLQAMAGPARRESVETVAPLPATPVTGTNPETTPRKKPGRPATGFDKKAYQRDLMRKRRAAAKAS